MILIKQPPVRKLTGGFCCLLSFYAAAYQASGNVFILPITNDWSITISAISNEPFLLTSIFLEAGLLGAGFESSENCAIRAFLATIRSSESMVLSPLKSPMISSEATSVSKLIA